MSVPGTRKKLLSLIEDVEIVSKELLEYLSTPRTQRPEDIDISQLVSLLTQKEKDIQETRELAKEQEELQKKMDALRVEVERRDIEIKQLQKNLKEAETVLAVAIYQAKQKLGSVNQANSKKISSEELIKYAHKISASNAVAAPPTWQPGDPRRPYPTDMDMRMGWLGRRGEIPSVTNSPILQSQSSYSEGMRSEHTLGEHGLPSAGTGSSSSGLSWQQHSFELPAGSGSGGSFHHPITPTVSIETKSQRQEDVELMSSDSSSSSSSDE